MNQMAFGMQQNVINMDLCTATTLKDLLLWVFNIFMYISVCGKDIMVLQYACRFHPIKRDNTESRIDKPKVK